MFKLLKKMIHPIFFHLCLWRLVGVFSVDAVKSVSVMEGESITLKPDAAEIQRDEVIEWRFGPNNILIARINRQDNKGMIHNDSANGRFRNRLQLDYQTGSLTITHTRTTDSGVYQVTRRRRTDTMLNTFNLTVYAPLHRHLTQCPSSSKQNCLLVCSVVNVSHVTLSWYKGNSSFSSISVSLPLEVEYQDKNTYSCVLNNPIRNQTQRSDCPCCGFTEAVIRLVHFALVGVATVVILVYEFRSLQQKRSVQNAANTE